MVPVYLFPLVNGDKPAPIPSKKRIYNSLIFFIFKRVFVTTGMVCLSIAIYPQVIESNISSQDTHTFITKDVQFFKSLDNIPFDSVIRLKIQSQFALLPDKPVVFSGYDPYYYWFRFVISNRDTTPKNLMLLMGPLGMRDALLYQKISGRWKLIAKTGNQYPFKERPYLYTHTVFPLTLPESSVDTFYLSMDETGNYKTFAFALLHPKALKLIENRVYFLFGIMIGLLLLFGVFNIYLFITLKEKIHLWYSLYIGWLIFLLMKNEGLDEQFLHLDSESGYRLTPIMGVGALAIAMLMHVVQLFLVNIRKNNILYKVALIVKYLLLVFAVAHFIVFYLSPGYRIEAFVFELANKTTIGAIVIILINCIYSVIRGFKPAIFILIGMIVFFIGSFERLMVISTSTFLLPPSIFQIGMVMETIIISFGLMYRYNQFKKDKEILQASMERQQIEAGNQMLLVQEAEQKRIAEDLHDELGGNLAAIKMTLQSFDLQQKQSTILSDLIDKAADAARNIAHNLMPPEFEQTSLRNLLENYFQRLSAENRLNFKFYCTGFSNHFNKQEELMIYRIIMELTANIVKHSQANEASLQMIYYEKKLEIMAEDNGKGININDPGGIGLKNIQTRINYLNGEMRIESNLKGTTVIIELPYKIM